MRMRWKVSTVGLFALDAVALAALGWMLVATRPEQSRNGVRSSVSMTLTFTAPDGVVSEVRFGHEGLRDTPLGECLLRSFGRVTAPRFAGAPVSVPLAVSLAPPAR